MIPLDTSPIRVLLPAAHDAAEAGLQAALASDPGFELVDASTLGFVEAARRLEPELIVFDPRR